MWNYTILQLSKSDVLLKLSVFDVQAVFYYFNNFKTFQVECQCLSKACYVLHTCSFATASQDLIVLYMRDADRVSIQSQVHTSRYPSAHYMLNNS